VPGKGGYCFVHPEKGVTSTDEALAGARDIMAEWMSEDAEARGRMQILYQSQGVLRKKMPQFEAQSLLAGGS
jgi:uncharacterized protein